MFTGIVQGVAELVRIEKRLGHNTFFLRIPEKHILGLECGASVSVDGVCLTVTAMNNGLIEFDVVNNSLSVTKLDKASDGSWVNYERSMTKGAEIGGHILSGHVDCIGVVTDIITANHSYGLVIEFEPAWGRFLFNKGFVGVDGASLTLSEVDKRKCEFQCWIIPETLRRTHFPRLEIGSTVNIEIDRETQVIVETISSISETKFSALIERLERALVGKYTGKDAISSLKGIIENSSEELALALSAPSELK